MTYNEQEFKKCWLSTRTEGEDVGTALVLEPGPDFYHREDEPEIRERGLFSF